MLQPANTGSRVAVVGATGLVGRTIVQVLADRELPVAELRLLASERSRGKRLPFGGEEIEVEALSKDILGEAFDVVFFAAGAAVSREWAPIAATSCDLVVDNSSAFRLQADIPLVVPEVNAGVLKGYRGIVANPNCSTIQMVVALQPLHHRFGLRSVVVSTYQSVSGSGAKGIRALEHEINQGERHPDGPYPYPIALNVLPQIDVLTKDGWTGEERKMIFESRKILGLPDLTVVPTAVRVPVRVGHSEALYAHFERPLSVQEARTVLQQAPGIIVQDCPENLEYPLAVQVEGRDEVFVGRIRQLPDDPHSLALWVVADNLRKGAATNAVQITEVALSHET